MAGCALRVSASTASPDSMTSITSQPSRIEARWNGQPAGSSVQGTPLPLGIRPWPGKVKAIFSTVGSIVPGDEVLANKRTNAPANPDASQARLPSWKTLGGPCGPDRPGRGAPALRRLRQPDPLRRRLHPTDHRLLALLTGGGADRRGGARAGGQRRGGPLPLVWLDHRGRGGPRAVGRGGDRAGGAVSGPVATPGQVPTGSDPDRSDPTIGASDGDGRQAVAEEAAADARPPMPVPDLADALLVGYLDAALATLRASSPTTLPGQLRQYQTWTPRRLKHPRVLAVVRRTLDLDQKFRAAVDERVLQEEDVLARLIRAGRHAEALASGEPPEAVARVGV